LNQPLTLSMILQHDCTFGCDKTIPDRQAMAGITETMTRGAAIERSGGAYHAYLFTGTEGGADGYKGNGAVLGGGGPVPGGSGQLYL
jgi:hypothetical protein